MAPASILRRHENTTVYLDQNSAALLTQTTLTFA
jgi:6-phosphogluconolactonase/glucosamine-6-phosphate isomerase/deaminase